MAPLVGKTCMDWQPSSVNSEYKATVSEDTDRVQRWVNALKSFLVLLFRKGMPAVN